MMANGETSKLKAYLDRNRLPAQRIAELTEKYKDVCDSKSDREFWDGYYRYGMDKLHESLDYSLNLRTFGALNSLIFPGSSVLELCCRGGFFGTYLAGSRPDIRYMGLDINPLAIENAKLLAKRNRVNPELFACGDYRDYRPHFGRPDIITGRNITNTGDYDVDFSAIKLFVQMADEIAAMHFTYEHALKTTLMHLKYSFEKHGYTFEDVSGFIGSEALPGDAGCIIFRAMKYFK